MLHKILFIGLLLAVNCCFACNHAFEPILRQALHNHFDIKASSINLDIAEQQKVLQQKRYWPRLSMFAEASTSKNDNIAHVFREKNIHAYPHLLWRGPNGTQLRLTGEQRVGKTQEDRNSHLAMSINIEQPLRKGFKRSINDWPIQNATLHLASQQLQHQQEIENVLAEALFALYAYQYEQARQTNNRLQIKHAKRMVKMVKSKIEHGLLPKIDYKQAQYQTMQVKLQQDQIMAEYAQFQFHLDALFGENALIPHVDLVKQPLAVLSYDALFQEAQAHDLTLKLLEQQKQSIKLQAELIEDDSKMDVRIGGTLNLGRHQDPLIEPWYVNKRYSAQLTVSYPITPDYELNHRRYENKQAYQKILLQIDQQKKSIHSMLQQLTQQSHLVLQQLYIAKQAKHLALESYQNAQKKLELGRASAFEVGVLRDKAFDAKLNYLQLYLRALELQIQAERTTGQLYNKWKNIISQNIALSLH